MFVVLVPHASGRPSRKEAVKAAHQSLPHPSEFGTFVWWLFDLFLLCASNVLLSHRVTRSQFASEAGRDRVRQVLASITASGARKC